MEFFSLTGEERLISAHPKTGLEAAVFGPKTFFFEYKQSNLPRAFIYCYQRSTLFSL